MLLTRRWLLITLAVIVIVIACVRLGFWQLERYQLRAERNAATEAAMALPPTPVETLLDVNTSLNRADEWRTVSARGTWDADNQIVLRYRRLDGQNGVHILTPLVTSQGPALLVDRGFVAQEGPGRDRFPEVGPPPSGEAEVVARVRVSETGRGLGSAEASNSIRYVDVPELAERLPYPIYGAWAELVEQRPPAPTAEQPQPIPPPTLTSGPSLIYAIQWWLFGLIGIVGYVILVRGEIRADGRSNRRAGRPPHTRPPTDPALRPAERPGTR